MGLSNKLSSSDMDRVRQSRVTPEYEPGFEEFSFENDEDGLDALFSDDEFFFDGLDTEGTNKGEIPSTEQLSPFNNTGSKSQVSEKDTFDRALEASEKTIVSAGNIVVDLVKSIKNRNFDDLAYYASNVITTSVIVSIASIVIAVIGGASGIKLLSFRGVPTSITISGIAAIGMGVSLMGISAMAISKYGVKSSSASTLDDIPDGEDNYISEYEDHIGDELEELLGLDFESELDNYKLDYDDKETDGGLKERSKSENKKSIDYDSSLGSIMENRVINRRTLVDTFIPLLPKETPEFANVKEIAEDSDEFLALETICFKAIANLINCSDIGETGSRLESAKQTIFAYELMLKRVSKVKNIDSLAREIEAYMREDSSDSDVNASVSIEGDYYKIIVSKAPERKSALEEPKPKIVTLGDILNIEIYKEYLLNEKNQLPIINGITELGEVLIEDAKPINSMMIVGKARSGKSWFVTSFMMSLMLFNTPESVQFVVVDPKMSLMFKTMSLMPHVCGLHNEDNILDVLDDIIEREAPRRKKLLADNRCEEIWALRKKGIMLPILYLVIDEYITVKNSLDKDEQKQFNAKVQTLMTQFPSQGIRILIVPHRSQGIVDKTNRTILDYIAAIRSDIVEVKDTLGLPKWGRALTQPGDMAIKSISMKDAMYAKGPALTTSDDENIKFIEMAAKAFYKMGVEIPDMSSMRIACNRDEDYIKETLKTGNKVIQYDVGEADSINLFDAF